MFDDAIAVRNIIASIGKLQMTAVADEHADVVLRKCRGIILHIIQIERVDTCHQWGEGGPVAWVSADIYQ